MSSESGADLVERTRSSMEATNQRRFDASMNDFARDAVFDMSSAGLGVFEGRRAIREYLEDWIGAYEEQEFKQWEGRDLGGGIVFVVAHFDARPVGSLSRVAERWSFTVAWRGGVIARVAASRDIDTARAAAERLARERE
jgi:ketosteroid isomerase-like protein